MRAAFGRIVGAGPAEIALLPSVSAGLAVIGDQLYGLGAEGSESLYLIDVDTGSATPVGTPFTNDLSFNDGGLAFDASGTLWGIADNTNPEFPPSDIFQVDRETGMAFPVATTVAGAESLAIAPPVGCQGTDFTGGEFHGEPVPTLVVAAGRQAGSIFPIR